MQIAVRFQLLSRQLRSVGVHDLLVDRILRQLVGFQLLAVTRSGIEVREILGHVVHGEKHPVRVSKDAERPLSVPACVSGRAFPYLIVELEVADALELLGVLRAIGD